MSSEDLQNLFAPYGEVSSAKIVTDKFNNDRSKGFGFVTLKDEKAAEEAVKEMNQAEVMERKLVVNLARPKKEETTRTDFTPTSAE